MLVHASSFSSTHSFVCLSCLLVFMVVWTFCSGGVSGFDPVYVFCCNVRSSYLFVSVTTCLLFTLLGPDHSECASGNALTDTAHTSTLGWNVVLQQVMSPAGVRRSLTRLDLQEVVSHTTTLCISSIRIDFDEAEANPLCRGPTPSHIVESASYTAHQQCTPSRLFFDTTLSILLRLDLSLVRSS